MTESQEDAIYDAQEKFLDEMFGKGKWNANMGWAVTDVGTDEDGVATKVYTPQPGVLSTGVDLKHTWEER